jgi:ASC-1-like (ASCH) protein
VFAKSILKMVQYSVKLDDNPDWLVMICDGDKKYEGRVPKPGTKWETIKAGDQIIFTNTTAMLSTTVKAVHKFKDFGEAFDAVGTGLCPVPGMTRKLCLACYNNYYTHADIVEHGVIAIELTV